jgi:heme exporter protein A
MLVVSQLAAARGDRTLFSGVNFALAPGELLEVVGTNGSGKTTLLRVLCGLLQPIEGEVRWNGENISSLREDFHSDLAYVGHLNGVKDDLTPLENVAFARVLGGAPDDAVTVTQALSALGLTKQQQRLPSKVLSQGQKRRVALARALHSRAKLWIFDEPFAALDVAAVQLVAERMSAHARAGGILVLSSHQDVAFDVAQRRRLRLGGAVAPALH